MKPISVKIFCRVRWGFWPRSLGQPCPSLSPCVPMVLISFLFL